MINRLLVVFLTTLLLVGCPWRPLAGSNPPPLGHAASVVPVRGQIGTLPGYHVQLTNLLTDFAAGSAVSLIDVTSGVSVASALADASGSFQLNLLNTFTPTKPSQTATQSVAYFLDAAKGIKGSNPTFNQAGAPVMRLRTLIWYDFTRSAWFSLSNRIAGPITISPSTTAVAFYINQQRLFNQPVVPEAFVGCINPALSGSAPADYTASGNLTPATYGTLFSQISTAISNDQDPIRSLVLGQDGSVVNTQTSFSVSSMAPTSGGVGTTVTISGLNFNPASMQVAFVGATATINQAASSTSSLVVTVPPGARSGLIRVTLNGVNVYTTSFTVTTQDGHSTSFLDPSGNLSFYAVSNDFGSLVRANPDGSTTTLSTSLTAPRALLVNPEATTSPSYRIYVADAGTNQIVQLNQAGTVLSASFIACTAPNANPSGMAIDPSGDLYIAETNLNVILRARVNWSTGTVTNANVATYTGLSGPTALAFDYNGYLYAVEPGQGKVQRFQPQAGDSGAIAVTSSAPYNQLDWAYLNDPEGIAIDTAGNCYVSSQANNAVFKVDPSRNMSAFASANAPRAVSRDILGNLYVADMGANLIRRITMSGDQRILAYGYASMRGLAVDGTSNLYVAMNDVGAVLKLSSDGVTTAPFLAGIAPPSGLTIRNGNLLIAHNDTGTSYPCCGGNTGAAIDQVTLSSGAARTAISSGLFWPGCAELSDDGSTYYVGRIYGTYGSWTDSMWWYNCWDNSGINIVNPGASTNTIRRPLAPEFWADGNWNTLSLSMVPLGSGQVLYGDRLHRKLVLSTTLNGTTSSVQWQDVTPNFGGSNVFPNDIYAVVYDGARYAYVSCGNGTIYRIDTTSYGAAPGAIGGFGTGYPAGIAMSGGVLYAADPVNVRVDRVLSPSTATSIDASFDQLSTSNPTSTSALNLMGLVSYGGKLYLADYNNNRIIQVNPSGWVNTPYVSLNGGPTRVDAYTDGRLLVRCSDAMIYSVSTGSTPVPSIVANQVGCRGCSMYDWYLDASNTIHWGSPFSCSEDGNQNLMHTHQVVRDGSHPSGNMLWMGATSALYAMNLSNGNDIDLNGMGNVMGVAVNPTTHVAYAGNSGGTVYTVDTGFNITNRLTLPSSIWGMAYDSGASKLYAVGNGNKTIYRVDPIAWTYAPIKVGLHAPMF
jgi:sugar lactone lactonase YvrE